LVVHSSFQPGYGKNRPLRSLPISGKKLPDVGSGSDSYDKSFCWRWGARGATIPRITIACRSRRERDVRPIVLVVVVFAALGPVSPSAAQHQVFTWAATSGANSNRWLQGGNWNSPPGTQYPGEPGTLVFSNGGTPNDEATFASVLPDGLAVGIDMSAGNGGGVANQLLRVGGISFQNNSNSLVIGNMSATDTGVLQLNGATLPVSGTIHTNIILSNTSTSQTLTIQNAAAGGTQTMAVAVPAASRTFAESGATIVISTAITGAGGITHYGAGTLVLSGANTYSGGTVVDQGTVRVANGTSGSATGTGTVSVGSGSKFSGTGTVIPNTGTTGGNTVTVNGTLQPGPDGAAGTMTVGSSAANATVSVNSTGTYRWSVSNVGSSSTTPGGSSAEAVQSELVVNGDLTFTPGTVEIEGLGSTGFINTQPYSWRVATGTGNVSISPTTQPTFSVTGLNAGSGSFFLSRSGGSVFVNFNPVPEPAAVLLLCGAAAGIVIRSRSVRRHTIE